MSYELREINAIGISSKSKNYTHRHCRRRAQLVNGKNTRYNKLEGNLQRELRERNITFEEYCKEMNPIIGEYVDL